MQGTHFPTHPTTLHTISLFATNDRPFQLTLNTAQQAAAMTNTAYNMPRRNMGYPAHMSYPEPAADEVVILQSAIALVRSQSSRPTIITCLLTCGQERPKSPAQCVYDPSSTISVPHTETGIGNQYTHNMQSPARA